MSTNTSAHLSQLQKAVQLHQSGNLAQAEAIYRGVLLEDPKQPDALHYLGMLLNQTGNPIDAIEHINASLLVSPKNAVFFSNLGTIYTGLREFDQAATAFRKAIALNPAFTTAIVNLGCTLKDQKQYGEALAAFQRALSQNKNLPDVQNHIGEIQELLKQFDLAEISFSQALQLAPDHVPALINLSTSLRRKKQYDRAASLCRQALLKNPMAWGAAINLGSICFEMKHYREARLHFTNALSMIDVNLLPNVGNIIHTHLGLVATREGRLADAVQDFKRAIELDSTNFESHSNLALVYKDAGKIPEALASFRDSIAVNPGNPVTHSNYLMTMLYDPLQTREHVFAEHKQFSDLFEKPFVQLSQPLDNDKNPVRKLRVGYVSADFWQHVVTTFFEPVLINHDKSQFHVTCFSNNYLVDHSTIRLQKLADNWIMCKDMSDVALCARIRKEKIDILIDLSGHSGENRLPVFARRAAPVQMTWIGYAGTTGLSNIDYRISDEYLDARGVTEDIHTETLIRLPGTQAAYKPQIDSPDVNALPSINSSHFVFACLNGIYKINQATALTWSRILSRVPNASLMLGNANDESATERLVQMFAEAGIDRSRLIFQRRLPLVEFLRLHHQIDLALDPFPYNGGTTTWHSLWMGVPVVTWAGDTPVSRCGAAVLGPLGLNQFIAKSEAEYIDIAVNASKNLSALAKTRADLRLIIQNSPSNDPAVITKNLERAYRATWTAWCDGRKLGNDFRLDERPS